MGIATRCFDVGMVQRFLYQFQIASLPQQFAGEVMTEIVEAEIGHASFGAHPAPSCLHTCQCHRVALPTNAVLALPCPLRNISKDIFGMMSLQREKDLANS